MTSTDIDILVQQGEGATLEFKEALSPASFARELVALANTIGGKILLGVRDDGSVKGIDDTNALRARVQDVARNCDPPVKVLVEPVGRVFVVHVRESDAKPVQCGDGFFWRQGAAGTSIRRIRDEAREVHCPEPEFEVGGFVTVTFRPNPAVRAAAGEVTPQVTGKVTPQVTGEAAGEVTPQVTPQVRLLRVISGEMTGRQLRDLLDLKDNRHFRGNYLLPALHDGHVEMTIPDRPRSSRQRYRLTPAGREHLKRIDPMTAPRVE